MKNTKCHIAMFIVGWAIVYSAFHAFENDPWYIALVVIGWFAWFILTDNILERVRKLERSI